MISLPAASILIVEGIDDDPVLSARAERLMAHMPCDDVRRVTDAELNAVMEEIFKSTDRHGMDRDIRPVVILNRFRLDDSEDEQKRRIEAFPSLEPLKLNGYGGFDWRTSGSPERRAQEGIVCQPAWHIHTVVGCHFRCAYCGLGWYVNLLLNIEEYIAHLDEWLAQCPNQKLFQWDNYTDTVCFEPEYGVAEQLVNYFAGRPGQALELYVGKSDNVDFLLDFDHRGHTVCCWSLSSRTQASRFEYKSASMEARIAAMRKCQDAGYPIRVRLSPIIPVRGWEDEQREMLRLLLEQVEPDVITMETIRFMDYAEMKESFDMSLLDEEFVDVMKKTAGCHRPPNFAVPHAFRKKVYDVAFEAIDEYRPETQIAFCRESFDMWDEYQDRFAAHGQNPGRYFCNCGPHCAPATAAAS